MAVAAAKKTTPTRRPTARSKAERAVTLFRQWLMVRDEAELLEERQGELRERLLSIVEAAGKPDDKGHQLLELSEPVRFKSHDGSTKTYRVLKREKHTTPAQPTPDRAKAVKLLKELRLWITPKHEKLLQEIGLSNPYVKITVDVDPDAVAQAYFKGLISEDQYDAILQEQKESWQFRQLSR